MAGTTSSTVLMQEQPAESKQPPGPYTLAWRRLVSKLMGRICLVMVCAFVLVAWLGPLVPAVDPTKMYVGAELQEPSVQHILGTDQFGRDILGRVVFGVRISLLVAVSAAAAGALIGVTTGVIAGFLGGVLAAVLMRTYDALLAFPTLLLAIAIASTTGTGVFNASLALAIVSVPQFARIARAGVLVERNKDYVTAAKCLGASDQRIMFREILPNIIAPALMQLTLFMAFAVLVESSLSFLGLGVQPPEPSLGSMLSEGRSYLRDAPWYCLAPGAVLTVLIFALNTLSDAVRDALDPRLLR